MPASITDAKSMILNTDYPIDKIIFLESGSTTVAATGTSDTYYNHGLPDLPLLKGTWSLTSDFTVSYDMGNPLYADTDDVIVSCHSTSTQYRVIINNNSASSKTVYWRIYGVTDEDTTSEYEATSSTADDFIFNTDYNYTKLYMTGDADISSATVNVSHNLGYRPQVDVWYEAASIPGEYLHWSLGFSDDLGLYNTVRITTTTLDFVKGTFPGQPTKYKYRIYLDE